jgi:hypothetical protein
MTTCTTPQEQQTEVTVAANDQAVPGILDSILVTYDTRVDNKKGSEVSLLPLSSVVEQIRGSVDLQKRVSVIRSTSSDEQRRELKRQLLPYFTFLHFGNGIRKSENFKDTRFILMDLDHIPEKLDILRDQMRHDPEVFMFFQSPSGDGLKVIFALDRDITTESEYKTIYRQFRAVVKDRYGVETDDIKEVARACFLSYDPDIYVNASPVYLSPESQASLPVVQEKPKAGDSIKKALQGTTPGGRTASMTELIGLYINRGFDHDFTLEFIRAWNKGNDPPHSDKKLVETVDDMYKRYDEASKKLPVQFVERNESYYKKSSAKNGTGDIMVTSFVIRPKELLVLEDNDCLVCDIKSSQGYEYAGVQLETTDWHSKQKLLKSIGHQDCVWVGSDSDLQALCAYVSSRVPVRKVGTKVIGLYKNTWVSEGLNITGESISHEPAIVPYEKGNGAFYHKISYANLSDAEHIDLVRSLYTDILEINERKVVLPLLGWFFATPVKEIIRSNIGAFPSVLMHGGQGSDKTSTAKLLMRMAGYKNAVPNKCDMKPFPMLKNLSATNGIPQFYDEFKESDLKDEAVDSLLRYIREIYDGELELKGREDQTTIEYELLAPIAVLGEWNISQPAIRERVLMVRFADSVKKNKMMRDAFRRILDLPLEGFMPRYIQFCLSQDINATLSTARRYVEQYFEAKAVAPRIVNNLAVMLLGLTLFQDYATSRGLVMPKIDPKHFLDDQLIEITGTDSGSVRSSVDQFIEELGIMWQKNEKQITSTNPAYEPSVKQVPWWTRADVNRRSAIAIRFNRVFPEFKEYASRTKYEGDLLDKESYLKLFKECDYVLSVSHPVDFDGKKQRCLCIDIEKARAAGIDLEGFGVTDVTAQLQE